MIPSFKHGIIASSRPRAAAAAGDVTPNAINWTDGVFPESPAESSVETISGINTPINIYYVITSDEGISIGKATTYSKNGGAPTILAENTNISVSNGDTIKWFYEGGDFTARSIDVKNASDSNAILDSIYFEINPFSPP